MPIKKVAIEQKMSTLQSTITADPKRADAARITMLRAVVATLSSEQRANIARLLFEHMGATVSKEQILYDSSFLQDSSDGSPLGDHLPPAQETRRSCRHQDDAGDWGYRLIV